MNGETSREKFVRLYPNGFLDPLYFQHERNYKVAAHEMWYELLNEKEFGRLLEEEQYQEICRRAFRIETKAESMLSRFEKSAIQDAVNEKKSEKAKEAAKLFASGLYDLIYGEDEFQTRFEEFCTDLASLPKHQSSPVSWPIATIFPFLAYPQKYLFLKPEVTKAAAKRHRVTLKYESRPNWLTYSHLLHLAGVISQEIADLNPTDMIDIQSYIWVTEQKNIPEPKSGSETGVIVDA